MKNPEDFLSNEERGKIVRDILLLKGAPKSVTVIFDKRYGFDFKVSKGERVVFSVGLSEVRFEKALARCLRACHEIKMSNADYIRSRG